MKFEAKGHPKDMLDVLKPVLFASDSGCSEVGGRSYLPY